jgi:hypothetical protein
MSSWDGMAGTPYSIVRGNRLVARCVWLSRSLSRAERDASLDPKDGRDMLLRGDRATLLRSAFAEPPTPRRHVG